MNVTRDRPRLQATDLLLGVTSGLAFAITCVFLPVMAYLCERYLLFFNAEMPAATRWVTSAPVWAYPLLAAAVITGLFFCRRRFHSRAILAINTVALAGVLLAGGFAVMSVSTPMVALIQSMT